MRSFTSNLSVSLIHSNYIINTLLKAKRMFDGEFASLEAMYRTETIRVPKPIKVFKNHSKIIKNK